MNRIAALTLALGLAAPTVASAADCVEIDVEADTLSADEQRSARILMS